MGVGGQRHAPAALCPGKRRGIHYTGNRVSPRLGLEGCGKSHPHRDFFCIFLYFACTSSELVCPDCPAICLLSLLTTHNTDIHVPDGIRTSNPSKRSATEIGSIRSPDHQARSQSRLPATSHAPSHLSVAPSVQTCTLPVPEQAQRLLTPYATRCPGSSTTSTRVSVQWRISVRNSVISNIHMSISSLQITVPPLVGRPVRITEARLCCECFLSLSVYQI